MAMQLSWNLDHTSTSAIQVATGLLHAATTDNVQPLAIMACEQFGNTLAISRDTIRKIEHCVIPSPQPAILAFLKCTVGYSANDCTSYFGKSLAGLQFLGLAAALVTCTDMYKAAEALQAMLVSTAKDKTLVPTTRQIRDLLARVEPRCHQSGFADDVAGWQLLLARHLTPTWAEGSSVIKGQIYVPGNQGLENLVDALRQLNRLGAADIARVTVRTSSCAVWTIAFVKWSLGCPPSVVSGNANVPVLEQPESRVIVVIPTGKWDDQDFSVTIHSSIHGPSDLVARNWKESTTGMISLQTYGQILLQWCDFDSGLAGKAFREAMPYSLNKAMKHLSKSLMFVEKIQCNETTASIIHAKSHQEENFGKRTTPPTSLAGAPRLSPFQGESAVSRVYELLFNEKLDTTFTQDEIDISDLPHVALFKRECQCYICHPHLNPGCFKACNEVIFYRNLSGIIGDVLALSLFDCPDLPRVSSGAVRDYDREDQFQQGITRILRNQIDIGIGLSDLLDRTMRILGHNVKRMKESGWVISSAKGQAVWPTIYEARSYGKRGYLSLSWHPGLLSHKGETYDLVDCRHSSAIGADPITGLCKDEVRKPCNLCPGLELDWIVSAGEHALSADLSVRCGPKQYHSLGFDPFAALQTLANALLVEHCQHDTNAELDSPNLLLKFSGPTRPQDPKAEISVVAVDGDDGLRFIALSMLEGRSPVVLRNRACLACCLEICQKTRSQVVIL